MSALQHPRELDRARGALLEDREDPDAQRVTERADVAGVADVLDLAGQGRSSVSDRRPGRRADGRISPSALSGSRRSARRAAGRRSRRRSRSRVSRPRGRYHCAVWLTIPSSAESASRRSPWRGAPRSRARERVLGEPLERLAAARARRATARRARSRGAPAGRRACGRGGSTTCATHRRTSARSCSSGSRGSASSASRALEQRVHQLVADRAQQLLLAAEVVVEAAGGEAERLGELGHRGLVVAALGEHARRAEHDLRAAAVVALAQGGPGRARAATAAERYRMIIRTSNDHSVRCRAWTSTSPTTTS